MSSSKWNRAPAMSKRKLGHPRGNRGNDRSERIFLLLVSSSKTRARDLMIPSPRSSAEICGSVAVGTGKWEPRRRSVPARLHPLPPAARQWVRETVTEWETATARRQNKRGVFTVSPLPRSLPACPGSGRLADIAR
jgi:hypothetical protein